MKRIVYGLAILCGLVSCGALKHARQPTAMPGTWQETPIVIDGDSKDWPSPYPNYDAKAMIAYATSNDRSNLYITMETGDDLTQLKALRQGIIISIDTGGGKTATFHINCPLQNDTDPLDLPPTKELLHMPQQFKQRMYKQAESANQYSLDGFPGCNGGYLVTQTAPCGVKVRLRIDEYKQLVWEAQVPFKVLYGTEELTPTYAKKPISVCYEVKGFRRSSPKGSDNTDMNQSMASGTPGAFGTNSRQRGMGGGTRTQESPTDRLYETSKTWKHFSLEYK